MQRIGIRIAAVAFAIMAAAGTSTPAHAFPSLPPGGPPTDCTACPPGDGPTLIVVNFYSSSSHTTLVGRRWFGCPGQPIQSWGEESPHPVFTFTPCNP